MGNALINPQFLPLVLLGRLLSSNRKLLDWKDLPWMVLEDLPARPWKVFAVSLLIMLPLSVVAEANLRSFIVVRRAHILLLPKSLGRGKGALIPAMRDHILSIDLNFLYGGERLLNDGRMCGKVWLVCWLWNEGSFSGEDECFVVEVEHGQ